MKSGMTAKTRWAIPLHPSVQTSLRTTTALIQSRLAATTVSLDCQQRVDGGGISYSKADDEADEQEDNAAAADDADSDDRLLTGDE